jgi:hypothetical protein
MTRLGLKFFTKDTGRDKVYAEVEGYQLDLRPVVEKAKLNNKNIEELPSWAKLVKYPKKGMGWFVTLLEGMFKSKHNLDGVNVDTLVDSVGGTLESRRVVMMFFPENTRNQNLVELGGIIQNVLGGWKVVVLNGHTVVSNADCEKEIEETIENNPDNNIFIVASKMAQRSFSEEMIGEVYLAYDRGQDGATIQKISRALTSNNTGKIARIFSLSFDPNRDDKLDTMVFQAALNQLEKNGTDLKEELKRVYRSIDIYSCNDDGAFKIDIDAYVDSALTKKGITRVMGKKSDLTGLTDEQIRAIREGNIEYLKNDLRDSADTGKTQKSKESKKGKITKKISDSEKDLEEVRKVIISIIEHSDIIMMAAKNRGAKNILDALDVFESNGWTGILENEFGIDYVIINYIFRRGVIKNEWIDLLFG